MFQRKTLRKVVKVDNEKIGLTIKEKKYIHARIIAHELRLKRIEEFLKMPAVDGVGRQAQESTEESPSLRS